MDNKFFFSVVIFILAGFLCAVTLVLPGKVAKLLPSAPVAATFDPLNTTYIIDGAPVTFVNGTSAMGQVFGTPTAGDLNGDGKLDAAVILVQDPGGSGTFYYVAAALATAAGTEGTNAVLLGDRIAPQTLEIRNGEIIANYADRNPGEPMTTQPSVGVSKYLTVSGTALIEMPPAVGAGSHCGGNMMNAPTCATGYHCAPEPGSHLPFGDVGGICVAN